MTALNKQALREAAQEEIMLRSVSDTSDAWQDEASPEAVLALLDELEAAEKRIAELERSNHIKPCPKCNDTGMADSGGTQPWGEPISVPCDCAAPPAPVSVPDEIPKLKDGRGFKYVKDRVRYSVNYANGWNACRAAMLQGAENAESRCTIKTAPALDSLTKNAESRCGNSPVIPEGWVLVPEEPTHEMLEAGDEQFGTYDVYRRMIEAAPKLE